MIVVIMGVYRLKNAILRPAVGMFFYDHQLNPPLTAPGE